MPYSPSERTGRSPSSVVCCFSAFYINILFNLHQTCAGPTLFEVGMLLYSAYIYPLFIDIFKGVVKYYQKLLVKRKDKPLIHDRLCEAELIDATGGQSWITWLKYVCKFSGITNLANISVDEISSNMRSSFEGTWLDEINKNSKLRTYCTIKGNFRCEDYLDTLQFNYRRQFTKLRLSAHKLHIETGRHTRPITPVKASAHSFKQFTSRLLKLSFSLSMHLYNSDGRHA